VGTKLERKILDGDSHRGFFLPARFIHTPAPSKPITRHSPFPQIGRRRRMRPPFHVACRISARDSRPDYFPKLQHFPIDRVTPDSFDKINSDRAVLPFAAGSSYRARPFNQQIPGMAFECR
jgi:hypothetical protein